MKTVEYLAVLMAIVLLITPQAASQSIEARKVVSYGPDDAPVMETVVAAYGKKLVAMWMIAEVYEEPAGAVRFGQ
jgi:hypothetical protein